MFPDPLDLEPFNPFNVGPANSGARSEFKIPTSVTYPPPVFVAKPEYVQAAAEQAALRSVSKATLKSAKSKLGEVAISKAIKDEMAEAKQQAAATHEKDRKKDLKVLKPKEAESKDSIRTLLPVRSNRQASGHAKGATSRSSVASKQRISSRLNIGAKTSKISSRYDSNTTLTSKSQKPFEPAKMSSTVIQSKVSETATQSSSKSSTKGSTSEQTVKSETSDPSSQHSVKPRKEAASKTTVKKSRNALVKKSRNTLVKKSRNTLVSESALSYGKPLTEQAADLAHRLNAGNANFRRYNSVARNHSTTVPQKLSEGDRMTFWFSDAVLS